MFMCCSHMLMMPYSLYTGMFIRCAMFCDISVILCVVCWVLLTHHMVCWILLWYGQHIIAAYFMLGTVTCSMGTAGTSLYAEYGHLLCWEDAAVCCTLICSFRTYGTLFVSIAIICLE